MAKALRTKGSPFDEKLRGIEKERKRVRDEIKALSRAVKKGQAPAAAPASRHAQSPSDTSVHGQEPTPSGSQTNMKERDLFSWNASGGGAPKADAQPRSAQQGEPMPTVGGHPGPRNRRAPVHGDQRFASYFTTGGFKSAPLPAHKDRGVQRNKLIFIVVVLFLLGYILYAIFS